MRNGRFELLYKIKCTVAFNIPIKKGNTFFFLRVLFFYTRYAVLC